MARPDVLLVVLPCQVRNKKSAIYSPRSNRPRVLPPDPTQLNLPPSSTPCCCYPENSHRLLNILLPFLSLDVFSSFFAFLQKYHNLVINSWCTHGRKINDPDSLLFIPPLIFKPVSSVLTISSALDHWVMEASGSVVWACTRSSPVPSVSSTPSVSTTRPASRVRCWKELTVRSLPTMPPSPLWVPVSYYLIIFLFWVFWMNLKDRRENVTICTITYL